MADGQRPVVVRLARQHRVARTARAARHASPPGRADRGCRAPRAVRSPSPYAALAAVRPSQRLMVRLGWPERWRGATQLGGGDVGAGEARGVGLGDRTRARRDAGGLAARMRSGWPMARDGDALAVATWRGSGRWWDWCRRRQRCRLAEEQAVGQDQRRRRRRSRRPRSWRRGRRCRAELLVRSPRRRRPQDLPLPDVAWREPGAWPGRSSARGTRRASSSFVVELVLRLARRRAVRSGLSSQPSILLELQSPACSALQPVLTLPTDRSTRAAVSASVVELQRGAAPALRVQRPCARRRRAATIARARSSWLTLARSCALCVQRAREHGRPRFDGAHRRCTAARGDQRAVDATATTAAMARSNAHAEQQRGNDQGRRPDHRV